MLRNLSFVILFLFTSVFLTPDIHSVGIELLPTDIISRGGLCVIIGSADDLTLAETLIEKGPWVIHWLDARESAVEEARNELQRRRLYGRIVVEHWDKDILPYADNLVNLLIDNVINPRPGVDELIRVLAPEGSIFIAEGEGYMHHFKTRPDEMGEWTHPWQGADGNLASGDRCLDIPNTFQWIAGPAFPMANRKDSSGAILSAGGRVFFITQNVPENIGGGRQNYLVARDAFNGIVLWSRPWEGPLSRGHADGYHEAIVVTENHVYGSRDGGVVVYLASDGSIVDFWNTKSTPGKLILDAGILVAQSPEGLTGFNIENGKQLWHFNADNPWGTLIRDGRTFFIVGTRELDGRWRHVLVSVDQQSGNILWEQQVESEYGHRNTPVLRLHFAGDGFVCLIERSVMRVLSAENGRELWRRESETEARGSGGMDSRQVGHFYVNGMIWMRADRASGGRMVPETWLALEPLTGEVVREIKATGPQGVIGNVNKISCQPLTANDEGGGFIVSAYEPHTGDIKWTSRIRNARYGMCDPLVTDGTNVYLLNKHINTRTGEISEMHGFQYGESERGGARVIYPQGARYLRGGKAGLLETSWTRLDMGLRKGQLTWTWGNAEGEIMAYTEDASYAFQIDAGGLDSRGRQVMWRSPVSEGGGVIEARDADADAPAWKLSLPAPSQVEAMITTKEALYISGPVDRFDPGGSGFLSIISHDQGSEISRIGLTTAPVHDGIAAANESIFAVLRDGSIIRLGAGDAALQAGQN